MEGVGSHYWFRVLLSVFYCAIMVLDLGLFRTSTELIRYGLDLAKSCPCLQKKKLHRRYQRDSRIGVFHCQPLRKCWFLTTTHGWDCLCEKLEVQRRSSSTPLAQFLRTDSPKKVRAVLLPLCPLSYSATQLSVRRDPLRPAVSPTGDTGPTASLHWASSAVQDADKRTASSLPQRGR